MYNCTFTTKVGKVGFTTFPIKVGLPTKVAFTTKVGFTTFPTKVGLPIKVVFTIFLASSQYIAHQ